MKEVREGFKMTKLGYIPTDWNIRKVNDFTNEHKQGFYTKEGYTDEGTYLIRITDLQNPKINFDCMPKIEIDNKTYKQFKVEEKDFLFARSGAIGRYGIVNKDNPAAIFASYLIRFKFDLTKINNTYFGYFYESNLCMAQLKAITQGSTNININADNIKSLSVPIPTIEEQQKIAEILSSVDEQIENTDQLIDKSKELKKGLIQQLMTKGIGHTEFKQTELGEIPVEWRITTLSEISDFITKGSTPTTYGYEWVESGIQFFKSDVVKEGRFVYGDYKFISEEAHMQMSRSKILTGDILITITGNIGRVAIVPKEIKESNINQHIARIRVMNESVNPLFVYHWLNQEKLVDYYMLIKTGLAYPQISLKQVRETIVPIPSNKEQQKIAEILSTIDLQIENYEQEKEKYAELKKGLMQQLLTGKLRVTV
ncbi:MAG: restriction endonuclease subunit S [Bacillus sp. (in: Bacteria)]|nr:restriction endonuclease subunit S [Bacillus sp. (in: firmicutes)]